MSLRSKRKGQTREALLQAVLAQSATGQSFSSLSLRQVTKLAGIVPAAFYRHFDDMESLGKALVEDHLTTALAELRKQMMMGQISSYKEQIRVAVAVFFDMVDAQPDYWHFIVTERWGGSPAVCAALEKHMVEFVKQLGKDLSLLPAFNHIDKKDKYMLAEIGINLFMTWVMGWLDIPNKVKPKKNQSVEDAINNAKAAYQEYCIRQTRLVFYGAANWQPSAAGKAS